MHTSPARRSLPFATALLACLAVVSPASATYLKGGNNDAYFKATVKGTQTTTWSEDHKPMFKCDSASQGSGKETVKFASTKAVVLRAFQFNKGPAIWLRGKGHADMPTKGYVERNGTRTLAPATPECAVGDGDGTYTPPPSDCGRKPISSMPLRVAHDALNKNRITLSNATMMRAPVFQQCPLGGEGWPGILSRDAKKRTAGEALPLKDLYDKRQGKMIVIGRGAVSTNSNGYASSTKITWTLTLTRLKRK